MREERARILKLLREGKITVEEAEQLLDALGSSRGASSEGPPRPQRRLCVRITDTRTGKVKTNVKLPPGAWGMLSKLTRTKLGRRLSGHALHDIQRAAREGVGGHVLDVTEEHRGERIEIFFE